MFLLGIGVGWCGCGLYYLIDSIDYNRYDWQPPTYWRIIVMTNNTPVNRFGKGNTRASKLNTTMVYRMRELYRDGATQGSLAREFGVSINQVGRIVRGESWQQYHNPAMPEIQTMQPQREITDEEIQASLNKLQGILGINATKTKKVIEIADNGIPLIIPKEDVKYSTLEEFITDVKEAKESSVESKLEKFLGDCDG